MLQQFYLIAQSQVTVVLVLYVMLVMFVIMEKHVYVKFLCETWENRDEYEMVKTAFQEEAVSCMQVLLASAALELGTHP